MKNKKEVLGQYFTKKEIVNQLLDLLFKFRNFDKKISILEPSYGTGNFINVLEARGYTNISGCEIDPNLTDTPKNFFEHALSLKYDLIIGNPPFTKYNLKESYYYPQSFLKNKIKPWQYLPAKESKSEKLKIENAFVYKALNHLKSLEFSAIGYILPISFFIKNKNRNLKNELIKKFKSIIIYQNDRIWFDYNIPCCFTIFSNSENHKNKILLIYENSVQYNFEFGLSNIHEELIPEVLFNKKHLLSENQNGISLDYYLDSKPVDVKKSYTNYEVSAKNILEKTLIPESKNIEDYKLAIVRVGNSSVGKAGLINVKDDVLNDMFFIFDLKENFKKDKVIKERLCEVINNNSDYFKKITIRVGSKSIKKEDIYNFKVCL